MADNEVWVVEAPFSCMGDDGTLWEDHVRAGFEDLDMAACFAKTCAAVFGSVSIKGRNIEELVGE